MKLDGYQQMMWNQRLGYNMYKIQYSQKAKDDLLRIKSYINGEFGDDIAIKAMKKITREIRNLEEHPLSGKPLSNMIDVPTDYLYLVIQKNYVFYRNEDKVVKIIRVLTQRQNFIPILFGVIETDDE